MKARKASEKLAQEAAAQATVGHLDGEFRLEAYRQSYLNFRHFDNLRWQVPAIAFVVGGALLNFGRQAQGGLPTPPVLAVYGVFALLCGYLMHRIGWNLRRNNEVLRRYALSFGDDPIPPKPRWKSASLYVEVFLGLVGAASLLPFVAGRFGW